MRYNAVDRNYYDAIMFDFTEYPGYCPIPHFFNFSAISPARSARDSSRAPKTTYVRNSFSIPIISLLSSTTSTDLPHAFIPSARSLLEMSRAAVPPA